MQSRVPFTPLEIMPRCSAAGLDFRIIPAGFNAPLEFLTGFSELLSLMLAAWIMGGISFLLSLLSSHAGPWRVPGHPHEGPSHHSIMIERYFLKDALSKVDLVPDIAGFFDVSWWGRTKPCC